jgi:mono/diheme cytochrome c family protein
MKSHPLLFCLLLTCCTLPFTFASADLLSDPGAAERGRYLMIAGGCNDCHTPGYMQTDGQVPEALWLTGDAVGFQGPWGTTYPSNLRLYAEQLTEAQWLARVRQPMRPPMPWFNLREMTDEDLVAMYHYLRALGPAGDPAPAGVGPGMAVETPYIEFVVKNLPNQASLVTREHP